LIGFFVNQLVLRNNVRPGDPFRDVLRKARALMLDAQAKQDAPYERVAAEFERDRESGFPRLFDIKFVFQPAIAEKVSLSKLQVVHEAAPHRTSKLPLTWFFLGDTDQIRILLEFDTSIFLRSTPQRLLDRFTDLLGRVVRDPDTVVLGESVAPIESLAALSASLEI
jgi:non-ribosomal peptide synthetase component F